MLKIYAADWTGLLEEGYTPNERQAKRYNRALEKKYPKALVVITDETSGKAHGRIDQGRLGRGQR